MVHTIHPEAPILPDKRRNAPAGLRYSQLTGSVMPGGLELPGNLTAL
jgi:hypothetical protein